MATLTDVASNQALSDNEKRAISASLVSMLLRE
jgi:hypothetical protein